MIPTLQHVTTVYLPFHVHKTAMLPNDTTLKWIFYTSAFPVSDVLRRKPTCIRGRKGFQLLH
jgi:hypothetical protein